MSKIIIEACRKKDLEDPKHWEKKEKWKKAIKLANLNDDGYGFLKAEDLPPDMQSNNGKTWARTAEKYFKITEIRKNNGDKGAVSAYEFSGFHKKEKDEHAIPSNVRKYFKTKEKNCLVLGTSHGVEIDHKYPYYLYKDYNFKNDVSNYQYISPSVNTKKREECKKTEQSGVKYDNRKNCCFFRTAHGKGKYEKEKITLNSPYDGQYFTDVAETCLRDNELYFKYFQKLKPLSHDDFRKIYIPLINQVIEDDFNVEDYDNVCCFVLEKIENKSSTEQLKNASDLPLKPDDESPGVDRENHGVENKTMAKSQKLDYKLSINPFKETK
jgi:hypothetical protein